MLAQLYKPQKPRVLRSVLSKCTEGGALRLSVVSVAAYGQAVWKLQRCRAAQRCSSHMLASPVALGARQGVLPARARASRLGRAHDIACRCAAVNLRCLGACPRRADALAASVGHGSEAGHMRMQLGERLVAPRETCMSATGAAAAAAASGSSRSPAACPLHTTPSTTTRLLAAAGAAASSAAAAAAIAAA